MVTLDAIKPTRKKLVYDLLNEAGIRVPTNKNQNFLSKCAFVQDKVVVINFWLNKDIKPKGSKIVVFRKLAKKRTDVSAREWSVREAIDTAYTKKLPIRVIILDGKPLQKGSVVFKRSLDNAAWFVSAFNPESGDCTLVRGRIIENAADDLGEAPIGNKSPDRAKRLVFQIQRDNKVRAFAIKRALGKCEYCNKRGFLATNEKPYLEAHHIIELSKEGCDTVDNVIALCPNHHRQAHFGRDAETLEAVFIKILENKNRKKKRVSKN